MKDFDIRTWLKNGAFVSTGDGRFLVGWGQRIWLDGPPNSSWFYFPDYFLESQNPFFTMEFTALKTGEELLALLQDLVKSKGELQEWIPPSKPSFEHEFNRIQDCFRETAMEKVVLYSFSKASFQNHTEILPHTIATLIRSCQAQPLYIYGFWDASQGTLGATPEVLFRYSDSHPQVVQTMALAGTEKNSVSKEKMLHDEKLLKEHNVVINDIIAKISGLGSVQTRETEILRLPTFSHLFTPIDLHVASGVAFPSLVHLLHPTPALGGYPKEEAMKWLEDYNRQVPRKRFGAPAGFRSEESGETACYVAIRNIQWEGKSVQLGAGCGILPQSIYEKEWEELLMKMDVVRQLMGFSSCRNNLP